ncbi:hypothetical protein CHL67_05210 [Prosthecochloris sp. GSB1]|uniref:hypothetical protein n=1 Tax=Prosthecochloris sp. GSB1 TaxID=281093 RepID=UPI000B8CC0D9|nr:hypothetical protein [Prosthecochloris sp. GSB1]ASQ90401.1 hypothetical protein CHL67_05210 [Prosthecochloris sp. GSB1]
MRFLKPLRRAASVALVSALVTNTAFAVKPGGNSGQSSSGTAKVTANIPEFIVLHYYSALTLNFETPTAEALDEGDKEFNVSWTGEATGDGLSTASLMDAKLELSSGMTTVNLGNVWAVRGFSKSGNAEVSITIPSGGDILRNGNSQIGMSNVRVTDGSSTGSSIRTNLGGIAKSSATFGGVLMELDFSKTNRSGSHNGGQYTITASTI